MVLNVVPDTKVHRTYATWAQVYDCIWHCRSASDFVYREKQMHPISVTLACQNVWFLTCGW